MKITLKSKIRLVYKCWKTKELLRILLSRELIIKFIITDVSNPTIDADFIAKYKLLMDRHSSSIIDPLTNLFSKSIPYKGSTETMSLVVNGTTPYHSILKEFPNLAKPKHRNRLVIEHRSNKTCLPVFARARRIATDKYKTAKTEFELGLFRLSQSLWAFSLHMVFKAKSGD